MKMLKPGDVCPCCGQPIKTHDPAALYLLSWIADKGRLPQHEEIEEMVAQWQEEGGGHE